MKSKQVDRISSRTAGQRMTESEGRALVEAWQASGLPVSRFCRERGVVSHLVHYWKRKLFEDSNSLEAATPEFVALDFATKEFGGALEVSQADSISIWAGTSVRIEIPANSARETFIRALRWTVEAMQS